MKDGYQRLPSGRWGNVRYPGTPVEWCPTLVGGDVCRKGRRCMYKHRAVGFTQERGQSRQ